MTRHIINSQPYAENVLLVGDPGRAKLIASHYLSDSKCISDNRGLLGYIGTYHGKHISVQTTGMGCASTAIVVEELISLGAKRFIRLGSTCLIASKKNQVTPALLLVNKAVSDSQAHRPYHRFWNRNFFPTNSMLKVAMEVAGLSKYSQHLASVFTTDTYYHQNQKQFVATTLLNACEAVDMETSIIYDIARFYQLEAISILNPIDELRYSVSDFSVSHRVLPKKGFETRLAHMIKLALAIIDTYDQTI